MEQIHILTIIFIAVFFIQFFFQLRYFFPFVSNKPSLQRQKLPTEAVSVIICAHNEIENLKQNLIQFLNQDFLEFEVIVVNDRSDDESNTWLSTQETQYPHLKAVHITTTADGFNPKKYALTKGIEAAQNDIILLSDADCQPASSDWIDRMSRSFKYNTSIVLGVSLYKKRKGFLNQFIRFETLQTALLYSSFAFKKEAYMGVGRNLAYRKSFFIAKGGFNDLSAIMGGDDDLWVNRYANKENTEICTLPEALTFSNPKESWASFFQQKKRHLSVGKYYKFKDKFKLGLFHFTQSLLWIIFILGLTLGNPIDCLILSFLTLMYLVRQYVVFYHLSIKFGIKFMHYNLPVLEILFILYYWIWGIYASLTKHLKWK
ncbi:glycosyltransferase [Marivirga sp.]|uniref:glycosyltransferase n=1 Tax=Marivirga sp. TaxID=2018662 RepID=UPI002D7F7002|nr:glycosyltransferase [Marivirga sp.]HET8859161.1 glycosyltransferase [Marivirga sp.]